MTSRRHFLSSLLGTAAIVRPALHDDWMRVIEEATRFVAASTVEATASEEDFWREIQRAFTVDRTIINLNNGGVSPSPRVVQEAMARYLAISNEVPAYSMWQLVE